MSDSRSTYLDNSTDRSEYNKHQLQKIQPLDLAKQRAKQDAADSSISGNQPGQDRESEKYYKRKVDLMAREIMALWKEVNDDKDEHKYREMNTQAQSKLHEKSKKYPKFYKDVEVRIQELEEQELQKTLKSQRQRLQEILE